MPSNREHPIERIGRLTEEEEHRTEVVNHLIVILSESFMVPRSQDSPQGDIADTAGAIYRRLRRVGYDIVKRETT